MYFGLFIRSQSSKVHCFLCLLHKILTDEVIFLYSAFFQEFGMCLCTVNLKKGDTQYLYLKTGEISPP